MQMTCVNAVFRVFSKERLLAALLALSLLSVPCSLLAAETGSIAAPRGGGLKSSFARFAGRWTAEEAVAFNELTPRTVDEEDWK